MSVPSEESARFKFVEARLLLFAGILIYVINSLTAERALHADEAGQWALLSSEAPHSQTADRFHGPALLLATDASLVASGISPNEVSPSVLRMIPLGIASSLLLLFYVLPSGHRPADRRLTLALAVVAILPFARFIQETLLVVALLWALVFWLRADGAHSKINLNRFLSGSFVGVALACKVSVALYLLVAVLSFAWFARSEVARAGRRYFVAGALFAWVLWQSSFLTDIHGLLTWWQQLGRALGLATGVSEEPLKPDSWLPWMVSLGLLSVASGLRWYNRAKLGAWGRHALDPVFLTILLIYGIHLALPYKTPWLLMGVDTVSLVLLIPAFVSTGLISLNIGNIIFGATALAALTVSVSPSLRSSPSTQEQSATLQPSKSRSVLLMLTLIGPARYDYAETSESIVGLSRKIQEVAKKSGRVENFIIQVNGTNYWPLPYYLKGLSVGYGDYPGAERANVRLLEASGPDAPRAEGYKVTPVELRSNEIWWVLVREDVELSQ
jgi:hypothetical protein